MKRIRLSLCELCGTPLTADKPRRFCRRCRPHAVLVPFIEELEQYELQENRMRDPESGTERANDDLRHRDPVRVTPQQLRQLRSRDRDQSRPRNRSSERLLKRLRRRPG